MEYLTCPKCHRPGYKNYCTVCGTRLVIEKLPNCPHCGEAIGAQALFCSGCGRPQSNNVTEIFDVNTIRTDINALKKSLHPTTKFSN